MITLRRGLSAGLIAGLIWAVLYFVTTAEPGRDLHTVAHWFALDSGAGRLIGFLLLIVLGGLFGLLFGALQRKRETTLPRSIVLGIATGAAFWLIVTLLIGTFIGQTRLTFGSFLSSFVLALVYGLLLGAVYFQRSVGRVEQGL